MSIKVVVTDDETFTIEGLTHMLNWELFHGTLEGTAVNGREALELVRRTKPDILISDIKMPEMDGLELSRVVTKEFPHISVILLSGHGEFEYAQRAIQYGVKDYILKPITREKIHHLETLMVNIDRKIQAKREASLSVWDSNFSNKILNSLRKSDKAMFDHFFQSEEFTQILSHDTDSSIGLQFLNFLFLYFSELQIKPEIIAASKMKVLEEYLDLTVLADKVDYILTRYYDVLTSMEQSGSSSAGALSLEARRYADTHYMDVGFNISALANELNISISHLSTVFKQSTGCNLSSYITALRMNRARELLGSLKYSISEVCVLSGYEDARYFAKLFKKKTGYTPSDYRNLAITGKDTLT